MQSRKLRSKKTTCSRFLQLPAEVQVKIFQSCLDLSYDIHITKASELPNSKLDVTYMARVGENEYNAIWHKGSSKPSSDLQILRLSRKIYPQARQSLTDCFSGNIFVNHHIIGHEKAEKSEWYDELIHAAGVPGEKITTLTLETGKLWHHDTTLNLQDWNAFGEFFDFTKLPKLQKVNLSLPFFGYPYEGYSHEVMNVTCDEDEATGKEMLGDKYDRRIIKFAAAKLPWTPSTTAHEIRSPDGTVVEIGLYGRLRNEPLAPYTDRRLDDLFNSRPDVVSYREHHSVLLRSC